MHGELVPSRNDEYLLYQILLGTWPLEPMEPDALDVYRERIQAYMLKAVREAKVHTSWISPSEQYESALSDFISTMLGRLDPNPFLKDFFVAQSLITHYGLLNGISQTLIKFASPGVPDIYQGNELWDFSLVDPDNRRPVDYARRAAALERLQLRFPPDRDCSRQARSLVDNMADGDIKLYVIWRLLSLRSAQPELFERGDYQPLEAIGEKTQHVCAFVRRQGVQSLIAVAPRLIFQLTGGSGGLPMGETTWKDTRLPLHEVASRQRWRDIMTGREFAPDQDTKAGLPLASLLQDFPVALLHSV